MTVDKQNIRILIVDDYSTMLRINKNLLKQLGFIIIEEAANGQEALDKLNQHPFDLIISDWNMEPMSGLELLIAVRNDPNLMNIPFIMMTAESKRENIIAAKQAGVTNYIVKPFNSGVLKHKLVAIFGEF